MTTWVIQGGRPLHGTAVAPPDKSIFHRALILAALGEGRAVLSPIARGDDNLATMKALRDLGVRVEESAFGLEVEGVGGPEGFLAPPGSIDCDNSGTTMRMLAGVLAASRITATLIGDASLSRRPMSRLLALRQLGGVITGQGQDHELRPPLTITGGPLRGKEVVLSVASAQVKSAILLAGLFAEGSTTVREPARSRDHTERMLRGLGVRLDEGADGAITVWPRARAWKNDAWAIAPDLSSAAFLLGAALVTKSPRVFVETGVNPTRAGFLEVLGAMGARFTTAPLVDRSGEPVAQLSLDLGPLVATEIEGARTLRAIDEIPLLAALAAFAEGTTQIRDAAELRVKESDRLASTARVLRAFGITAFERPDGLSVTGGPVHAAEVDAEGDHRIAMSAAVLALAAPGTSRIHGAEAADVSFPGFAEALIGLGALVHFAPG